MLMIALGLALLCIPKGELHLLLSDHHTHARDIFYRYYTQVAEWFPYIVCVLVLLFGRIGDGVFASVCMIVSALTTQLFKFIVNAPRPLKWFEMNMPDVQLCLVDGMNTHSWHSFPSGHTTSFFALALVLCILLTRQPRNPRMTRVLVQIVLFVLAALGGYSRIYLNQHFALDVLAGIFVGLGITILFYLLFSCWESKKWYNYRVFAKK